MCTLIWIQIYSWTLKKVVINVEHKKTRSARNIERKTKRQEEKKRTHTTQTNFFFIQIHNIFDYTTSFITQHLFVITQHL